MTILYMTYALDGLLPIAIPILLAVYLTRKYDLYWRLFWIGAAVFALAQIGLAVFNNYVFYPFIGNLTNPSSSLSSTSSLVVGALLLGISTAVFEELLRYGMFRWWAREARSWVDGVLTGVGHGGAASIFLGALVIYNFVNMVMVRNMDISTLVTPEQLPFAQAQIAAFWSAPWYTTLNDIFQQVFILAIQIALALVVLQSFVRKQLSWVLVAIGAHLLFEFSRLLAQNLLSPLLTDAVFAFFGVAAITVIFLLRPSAAPNHLSSDPAKA